MLLCVFWIAACSICELDGGAYDDPYDELLELELLAYDFCQSWYSIRDIDGFAEEVRTPATPLNDTLTPSSIHNTESPWL